MKPQNSAILALNVCAALTLTTWAAPRGTASENGVCLQPEWVLKYGDEFWRPSAPKRVVKTGTGVKPSRNAPAIDVGEVVERVSHALSRDKDTGLPSLRADTYAADFDGLGLRFSSAARKAGQTATSEARFRTRTV